MCIHICIHIYIYVYVCVCVCVCVCWHQFYVFKDFLQYFYCRKFLQCLHACTAYNMASWFTTMYSCACEGNYKITDPPGCERVMASIITGELYMYVHEHKHTHLLDDS